MKTRKNTRKGFSLVELVVVILIIAVLAAAVFAGGSAAIKKSQISRTTSDLHNFQLAIESAVNETPSVANIANSSGTNMDTILKKINENLDDSYALTKEAADTTSGNLRVDAIGDTWQVYKSAKTDAWGNNYYVILDCGERHLKGQSDFYVTVVSAGPNAQTVVAGEIEADDLFMLTQYSDGDVVSAIYNCGDTDTKVQAATDDGATPPAISTPQALKFTKKGVREDTYIGLYAGGKDNTNGCFGNIDAAQITDQAPANGTGAPDEAAAGLPVNF